MTSPESIQRADRQPPGLAASILIAWIGFAVMTGLAMWNESRPGTPLDDPILRHVPYVPWIERWNYWIWVVPWLLGAGTLMVLDPREASRMWVNSGIVSVLRGVCVCLAGLGPVRGPDVNAHLAWDTSRWADATLAILNPWSVFTADAAHVWLTKDTLFSGHTASTFLLVLHASGHPRLRMTLVALHLAIVATVFLGHIHYSVDVVVAWIVTWLVYRCGRRLFPPA